MNQIHVYKLPFKTEHTCHSMGFNIAIVMDWVYEIVQNTSSRTYPKYKF